MKLEAIYLVCLLHKWIAIEFFASSDDAANYELIIEPVKDKSFFEFIDKQLISFNLWYSADLERAQILSRSVIGKWKVCLPQKFEFFTLKSLTSQNYFIQQKRNYLNNFMYFSLLFQCLVIPHISLQNMQFALMKVVNFGDPKKHNKSLTYFHFIQNPVIHCIFTNRMVAIHGKQIRA